MKILTVFLDMLRNEQVYNEEAGWENMILRDFFLEIGGTLFSSCYTPAPDSYRSLACFWQSQYPLENGCNSRTMKTYDYLKFPKNTFLAKMKHKGYQFNCFGGAWNNDKIGFLPAIYDPLTDNMSTGKFLREYLQTVKLEKDSFTFINLEDLHFIIEDEYADHEAFLHGTQKLVNLMKMIFINFSIKEFDEIIFFSDHGFRYYYEQGGFLLDKRRSNIFLFWHHRGDKNFNIDTELRSIMDIYPTILNRCEISFDQEKIEGRDLFLTNGHKFLMLEEHRDYYSKLLDPICRWAVIDNKKQFYFVDETIMWMQENDGDNDFTKRVFYENQLSCKMTNFREIKEMNEKQKEYKNDAVNINMIDFYSDGTARKRHPLTIPKRIKRKLHKREE